MNNSDFGGNLPNVEHVYTDPQNEGNPKKSEFPLHFFEFLGIIGRQYRFFIEIGAKTNTDDYL